MEQLSTDFHSIEFPDHSKGRYISFNDESRFLNGQREQRNLAQRGCKKFFKNIPLTNEITRESEHEHTFPVDSKKDLQPSHL
jgi:hypothetical protein